MLLPFLPLLRGRLWVLCEGHGVDALVGALADLDGLEDSVAGGVCDGSVDVDEGQLLAKDFDFEGQRLETDLALGVFEGDHGAAAGARAHLELGVDPLSETLEVDELLEADAAAGRDQRVVGVVDHVL